MAIGWITLLKGVPWSGVISTAPLVAEGAKQLWKAVSKQPPSAHSTRPTQPDTASTDSTTADYAIRLAAQEAAINDLRTQMLKSSELIKVLADQNTQLIRRVEANRVRTRWLTGLVAIVVLVAVTSLVVVMIR
ncbi:MAG TPA: hypothetical protein VIN38_08550 [Thiobacillus sp.]